MAERFELRMEEDALARIDGWRREQPDMPSRSEAARRLINAGIGENSSQQLFEIARFNVLSTAMQRDTAKHISDGYLYAWQEGVYPAFNTHPAIHAPFRLGFRVAEELVDELATVFDDAIADKKPVPSFYKLESIYDVRSGRGPWDRGKLIVACRYMFLNETFGEEVWGPLLRGSDHPSEARSIIRKFDRQNISF